jgi:hypothetical protein
VTYVGVALEESQSYLSSRAAIARVVRYRESTVTAIPTTTAIHGNRDSPDSRPLPEVDDGGDPTCPLVRPVPACTPSSGGAVWRGPSVEVFGKRLPS